MRRTGVWLAVLTVVVLAQSISTQDLVAAAKREGRLVLYGSLTTLGVVNRILESRYGIPVEYWRAASTRVLDRGLNETHAGRPQFDVVQTNSSPMMVLREAGAFARYASPSYEMFAQSTRDPQALVSPQFLVIPIGIVYDTRRVRPEEAPRSLADLLDPRWEGKVVMADPTLHTTTTQWLMELRRVLGGQWRGFLEGLAGQAPTWSLSSRGGPPGVQRVPRRAHVHPVRVPVRQGGRSPRLRRAAGLPGRRTPHRPGRPRATPNAGKLYIKTLLSRAGLLALAQDGDFVSLPGVLPSLPDADKIRIVAMRDYDEAALARAREELGRIFRRR